MCEKDKRVKVIFNEKNFGYLKSLVYGLMQTTGDCSIMLRADFQDPIELISVFVKNGRRVIRLLQAKKYNQMKIGSYMRFVAYIISWYKNFFIKWLIIPKKP